MSALTNDEIRLGLVAYLEEDVLRSSMAVTWYEGKGWTHGEPERRPFVCFELNEGQCKWAPVTTQARTGGGTGYRRVELLREWRSGGDKACYDNQWIGKHQYLMDGAKYFVGPIAVFIDASKNECSSPATRALLNNDGIKAIRAEVERQENRRFEPRGSQ